MSWIEAFILGLVQGLTEFLPVSSSGHLIIGKELLGVEIEPDTTFEVLVHFATVLSTIIVFRNEIWKLIQGFLKFKMNEETQYILMICVSMIPIFIVGLFFKKQVDSLFGEGVVLVGCMLIVTAILLSLTHFLNFKQRKEFSYLSAFIIGVSQAIAVLPGLSRSGATISTGLLLGNKKEEVTRFSFLMVLIPILGITFLDIVTPDKSEKDDFLPEKEQAEVVDFELVEDMKNTILIQPEETDSVDFSSENVPLVIFDTKPSNEIENITQQSEETDSVNISSENESLVVLDTIPSNEMETIIRQSGKKGISMSAMISGFLAAFLSGLFACKVMIAIVKRSKLIYFAIYCAVVGISMLIWQLVV